MHEGSKNFRRTVSPPKWEGVIFPGLEREDPRAVVYEADLANNLKPFIEAIWFMTWDIPEGVELHGIGAPIPCIKLMANNFPGFAKPVNTLLGVKDKGVVLKFKGSGQAIGIDFKPGGLFPFIGSLKFGPEAVLNADDVLLNLPELPLGQWDLTFAEKWLQDIHEYFEKRLNHLHPHHLDEISKLVEIMLKDQDIPQVEELLEKSGMSKRTLQRVFQNEVGLSMKETLRIARFNLAIRKLNGSDIENFAQFALESGYFDQPHMVNDFKKLVSESPKVFRKYW